MSKELVLEGHAMFAFDVLTREYAADNTDIEHNRDEAVFLCLAMLNMCRQEHLIAAVRDQVIQEISRCLLDDAADVENIMTSLQCAIYTHFDISQVILPQTLADRILSLQQPDGSFASSHEPNSASDTRNIADGLIAVYLLHKRYAIDISKFDYARTNAYLDAVMTIDGAIGMVPDSESHGGAAFLSICARTLLGRMYGIEWTTSRRLINRLINYQEMFISGRPNKPPCLCYNLWVYGALNLLGMHILMNLELLIANTLKCEYSIPLSEQEEAALTQLPHEEFRYCRTKEECLGYLLRKYGYAKAGFVLGEDKPDPLHTYAPLIMLAGEGMLGMDVEIDFATFQEERNIENW